MTTLMPAAEVEFGLVAAIAATSANASARTVSRTDRWRDARWAPLSGTGKSLASSPPEQPEAHGLTVVGTAPGGKRGQQQGRTWTHADTRASVRGTDRGGRSGVTRGHPRLDRVLPLGAAFLLLGLVYGGCLGAAPVCQRRARPVSPDLGPWQAGPFALCPDAPGRRAPTRAAGLVDRPTRRPSGGPARSCRRPGGWAVASPVD